MLATESTISENQLKFQRGAKRKNEEGRRRWRGERGYSVASRDGCRCLTYGQA